MANRARNISKISKRTREEDIYSDTSDTHVFRLATIPYGLDSNVTQLLANLLTKSSVFYYLPIVSCNLVLIKLLLLLLLL